MKEFLRGGCQVVMDTCSTVGSWSYPALFTLGRLCDWTDASFSRKRSLQVEPKQCGSTSINNGSAVRTGGPYGVTVTLQ